MEKRRWSIPREEIYRRAPVSAQCALVRRCLTPRGRGVQPRDPRAPPSPSPPLPPPPRERAPTPGPGERTPPGRRPCHVPCHKDVPHVGELETLLGVLLD